MAVHTWLYGSETWILNREDYSSQTSAEMVYLWSVKGYTRLGYFRNEDIRKALNVTPIFYIWFFVRHKSTVYKQPTRCNFGQDCLLTTAKTLYMFRTLSAPIIRSTKNCSSSHESGWCISSKDVQGRFTTLFHSRLWNSVVDRPWTSLLDIHHPDPWHVPVAATTVFSTPDDGRGKRSKHVECTCSC